ncbi:molybdopterin molybdotransferase MoeA [Alteribacillus iranensis]|uniref:Molybdopterin molybdenumtransferase n=1 Tax=Alteribacillus iranensis TaxID=930128 RepID=A0A1I2BA50_9BACI|nr:molybdopterin molybdotransferase MoeA [Alteribacillus iranensis]SFE52949.1 molybdopterin molybdochelatase [Alteribacillus iranensis]
MIKARQAIKIEEARDRLLQFDKPLDQIDIPVDDSIGFVVAEDQYAPVSIPSFRRSLYDGYAIRKEDDGPFPKEFTVVGNVPCGFVFPGELGEREAVRIMTGAKVPDSAGKIIMLEQTETTENPQKVRILDTHETDNINPIGSDFRKEDKILSKGEKINSGTISLFKAFGMETISVYRKPKAAVLSTGSELLSAGEALQDGKIYDSNKPLLEQLLREHGSEVTYSGQLADEKESIEKELTQLAEEVDLIVTTGGVSVGDFDFMADIVLDNTFLFNKIQMRPGSPTSAAMLGDTLLMALSGNPGACYIGFQLFIRSYISQLLKTTDTMIETKAVLEKDYLKQSSFDRILRGQYRFDANGQLYVTPVGSDQSSSLGNLHQTTCLINIPGHSNGHKRGDTVQIWLL